MLRAPDHSVNGRGHAQTRESGGVGKHTTQPLLDRCEIAFLNANLMIQGSPLEQRPSAHVTI